MSVPQVSSFLVSPDAGAIAVSSAEIDWNTNQQKTSWTHLKGNLPFDPNGAANIVWNQERSRVAFFRAEKGKTILYATSAGGVIQAICELYTSNAYLLGTGNRISWSAKGDFLAFVGTLDPPPSTQDPFVIDRIQYKNSTGFSDNRRSRVFVVNASPNSTPRALTSADRDSHSVWWGVGSEVIYLANPGQDGDANHNYDIYGINAETGAIRTIVASPGVEMEPQVSPNGKWIAYRATTRSITTIDSVAEDTHIWIVPYAGGKARELNRSLDRRCTQLRWMPDSQSLVYLAADRGTMLPYRTSIESQTTKALLTGKSFAGGLQVTTNSELYMTLSGPLKPADLIRLSPSGEITRLTSFADDAAKRWKMVEPETIRFKSFDQTEVEAFLYPPLDRSGKWPLILNVHGGPHSMHGYGFNGSAQYYAVRGYATLAVNPRGSVGYGQKFSDGCLNDWGGGDYRDLMAAVDEVLRRNPQVDANRLGVMGSSYGGYMANWIVTQTSRFRAAVPIASLSNLISFYATSLYQDLIHAEFNGFPWAENNFKTLWDLSPLAHVKNVKTPVLLLHGESDNDVHITQSEEMYAALRHRNVPVTMVRYPREGHVFRESKHKLDVLKRVSDWMDRYLN